MANTHDLFQDFCSNLNIISSKRDKIMTSREYLRDTIRDYFSENHSDYPPEFYIQGSWKMKTAIRTKDDTCDLDDGVYFSSNPKNVTATTLQGWVKDAVNDVTDSSASHNKMCITVDYKAGYNIDLPVYLFREGDNHPYIAVKNEGWREDDPKEMVAIFQDEKRKNAQILRIVKYLKAWGDNKRNKMPSGLAMTILAMNNYAPHDRDDVALKNTLISIERALTPTSTNFKCVVPATPNDDIFENYQEERKRNFMDNLSTFITDAKKAVDEEKNFKTASELWRKHFGNRWFPIGKDEEEKLMEASKVAPVVGVSKPYAR